jgi:hypothetical protein
MNRLSRRAFVVGGDPADVPVRAWADTWKE